MMRTPEIKILERWDHSEASWAASVLSTFASSGYRLKAGAWLWQRYCWGDGNQHLAVAKDRKLKTEELQNG